MSLEMLSEGRVETESEQSEGMRSEGRVETESEQSEAQVSTESAWDSQREEGLLSLTDGVAGSVTWKTQLSLLACPSLDTDRRTRFYILRNCSDGLLGLQWEEIKKENNSEDFPGGPWLRLWAPNAGAWLPSLVRELDSTCCGEDWRPWMPELMQTK